MNSTRAAGTARPNLRRAALLSVAALAAATGTWSVGGSPVAGQTDAPTLFVRGGAEPSAAEVTSVTVGQPTDRHLLCDWNGDGTDTIALYRPADATWHLRSPVGDGAPGSVFRFGRPGVGDRPLCGDWDGDGTDRPGLFRVSNSTWYLAGRLGSGAAETAFRYGRPGLGDVALAGDWDGDGTDTPGVFRSSTSEWLLRDELGGGPADRLFRYGRAGEDERQVVGDWDGDGTDTPGVFRPANRVWHLRNSAGAGAADWTFAFGSPHRDRPLAGDWDGDGADEPVVARSPTAPGQAPNPRYDPVLPGAIVVGHYGSAFSPRLGVLGTEPPDRAAHAVEERAAQWTGFGLPVVPAFDYIASIATRAPGPDGDYSSPSDLATLRRWLEAVRSVGGVLILDIQPGQGDFPSEVRRYESILAEPDVGLALDPEWRMPPGVVPGTAVGSVDADEVNAVTGYLARLVRAHDLPRKPVILHQFKSSMIRNRSAVVARPELATVVHMDGFGSPALKRSTYRTVSVEPPLINGFKLFLDEDSPLMTPEQVRELDPPPVVITYQ